MASEACLRVANKNFPSHHQLPYFRDNIESQTDAKVPHETSNPRLDGGTTASCEEMAPETCLSVGRGLQTLPTLPAAALPAAHLALKSW